MEAEARILANESPGDIAQKVGCSLDAVQAFEKLFYDVRGCLSARDYIMTLIGPRAYHGLEEQDVDAILKLFGFFGGGRIIDILLDYFKSPPVLPAQLDTLDSAELERLRTKLMVKAVLLVRTLPGSSFLAKLPLLIDIGKKLVGTEAAIPDPDAAEIKELWAALNSEELTRHVADLTAVPDSAAA